MLPSALVISEHTMFPSSPTSTLRLVAPLPELYLARSPQHSKAINDAFPTPPLSSQTIFTLTSNQAICLGLLGSWYPCIFETAAPILSRIFSPSLRFLRAFNEPMRVSLHALVVVLDADLGVGTSAARLANTSSYSAPLDLKLHI